jgi:hypothetical protein
VLGDNVEDKFQFREGQIAIYKANMKRTGSAAQFKYARDKKCMFLEMAKQSDEKAFDWANKIVVKLGETDITKMLALFGGTWPMSDDPMKKPDLSLFHENAKGNKIININKQRNPQFPGFYMTVSVSEGEVKDRISIPISPDEVEYLKIGLTKAIESILGW